jgi:diguanylate cyclase (GGDEF)-like protein
MSNQKLDRPIQETDSSAIACGDSGEVADLGTALANLSRELETKSSELKALLTVTEMISSGLILDQVLEGVFEAFKSIIPYDRIGLALIEPDGRTVRQRWVRSNSHNLRIPPGYCSKLEGSSLQQILQTRHPRVMSNLATYLEQHPDSDSTRRIVEEGMLSSLTCPLIESAGAVGFLFFSSMRPNVYNDAHGELFLQIAGQISSLVEKGRLYQAVLELNQELLRRTAELERSNETTVRIMNEDPLTGVLNRRGILEVLGKAVSLARRTNLPLSLIILDLDHFKEVNDRHGHLVGDRFLAETACLLVRCCRQEDSVCRFGGEEFLVLLPNTPLEDAVRFCERLRLAMLQMANPLAGRTASFGVSELTQSDTVDSFIDRCDRAMYQAKESGRNRICTL